MLKMSRTTGNSYRWYAPTTNAPRESQGAQSNYRSEGSWRSFEQGVFFRFYII
jgi:hypothetical protein